MDDMNIYSERFVCNEHSFGFYDMKFDAYLYLAGKNEKFQKNKNEKKFKWIINNEKWR